MASLFEKYKASLNTAENKAKKIIRQKLSVIGTSYLDKLISSINDNPNISVSDAFLLTSNQKALGAALKSARTEAEKVIRATHLAGISIGKSHAFEELKALGLAAPRASVPSSTVYLESVLSDLRRNFDLALSDMGFRVQQPLAIDHLDARIQLARKSLDWAVNRLNTRSSLGAIVALNRSYSDAQLAVYTASAAKEGFQVRKKWTANWTANKPCVLCQRLDGTVVDLGLDYESHEPVYRDLPGPPRHPNCECRLSLVIG